jgi:hypothetical protein
MADFEAFAQKRQDWLGNIEIRNYCDRPNAEGYYGPDIFSYGLALSLRLSKLPRADCLYLFRL